MRMNENDEISLSLSLSVCVRVFESEKNNPEKNHNQFSPSTNFCLLHFLLQFE